MQQKLADEDPLNQSAGVFHPGPQAEQCPLRWGCQVKETIRTDLDEATASDWAHSTRYRNHLGKREKSAGVPYGTDSWLLPPRRFLSGDRQYFILCGQCFDLLWKCFTISLFSKTWCFHPYIIIFPPCIRVKGASATSDIRGLEAHLTTYAWVWNGTRGFL